MVKCREEGGPGSVEVTSGLVDLGDAALDPRGVGRLGGGLGQAFEVLQRELALTAGAGDARQCPEDLAVFGRLFVELAVQVPGFVGLGQVVRQQRPHALLHTRLEGLGPDEAALGPQGVEQACPVLLGLLGQGEQEQARQARRVESGNRGTLGVAQLEQVLGLGQRVGGVDTVVQGGEGLGVARGAEQAAKSVEGLATDGGALEGLPVADQGLLGVLGALVEVAGEGGVNHPDGRVLGESGQPGVGRGEPGLVARGLLEPLHRGQRALVVGVVGEHGGVPGQGLLAVADELFLEASGVVGEARGLEGTHGLLGHAQRLAECGECDQGPVLGVFGGEHVGDGLDRGHRVGVAQGVGDQRGDPGPVGVGLGLGRGLAVELDQRGGVAVAQGALLDQGQGTGVGAVGVEDAPGVVLWIALAQPLGEEGAVEEQPVAPLEVVGSVGLLGLEAQDLCPLTLGDHQLLQEQSRRQEARRELQAPTQALGGAGGVFDLLRPDTGGPIEEAHHRVAVLGGLGRVDQHLGQSRPGPIGLEQAEVGVERWREVGDVVQGPLVEVPGPLGVGQAEFADSTGTVQLQRHAARLVADDGPLLVERGQAVPLREAGVDPLEALERRQVAASDLQDVLEVLLGAGLIVQATLADLPHPELERHPQVRVVEDLDALGPEFQQPGPVPPGGEDAGHGHGSRHGRGVLGDVAVGRQGAVGVVEVLLEDAGQAVLDEGARGLVDGVDLGLELVDDAVPAVEASLEPLQAVTDLGPGAGFDGQAVGVGRALDVAGLEGVDVAGTREPEPAIGRLCGGSEVGVQLSQPTPVGGPAVEGFEGEQRRQVPRPSGQRGLVGLCSPLGPIEFLGVDLATAGLGRRCAGTAGLPGQGLEGVGQGLPLGAGCVEVPQQL